MKAVIFDLNGIFIKSAPLSKRVQQDYGVPQEFFLPLLNNVLEKARKPGAAPIYDLFKPYLTAFDLDLGEKQMLEYWFSAESEDPEMAAIAHELKEKGYKLFVLSNNFRERADYYRKNFSCLALFDKVYFSHETGFVKPDEHAWKNVLMENNLEAKDCVYLDDSVKNVQAAKKLGIDAHLFENTELAKRLLERILVAPSS